MISLTIYGDTPPHLRCPYTFGDHKCGASTAGRRTVRAMGVPWSALCCGSFDCCRKHGNLINYGGALLTFPQMFGVGFHKALSAVMQRIIRDAALDHLQDAANMGDRDVEATRRAYTVALIGGVIKSKQDPPEAGGVLAKRK